MKNQPSVLMPMRPTSSGVAHLGDAAHQGGEYQRRDDHFDQAQEQCGHQRHVVGKGDRIGHVGVRQVAGEDAKCQSD